MPYALPYANDYLIFVKKAYKYIAVGMMIRIFF